MGYLESFANSLTNLVATSKNSTGKSKFWRAKFKHGIRKVKPVKSWHMFRE